MYHQSINQFFALKCTQSVQVHLRYVQKPPQYIANASFEITHQHDVKEERLVQLFLDVAVAPDQVLDQLTEAHR